VAPTLAARLAPALEQLADGALARRPFALELWDGSELPATAPSVDGARPAPRLRVRDPRALATIARHPDQLGLGRAWVTGALELDGDVEAALAACEPLSGAQLGWRDRLRALRLARQAGVPLRPLSPPAAEARLHGRRHSLRRDRIAVRHHYDVPTSFYRLVLGPSLVYSCACFADPGESLEAAQERKLELVCRKLALEPGMRVLDVGCGWGSFATHAATRHDVSVVGITLSPPQAERARKRVAEAGVSDRVEVRVADYRELADEPFDAVASIGMVEHVGAVNIDAYATTIRRMVRPGGRVLNHGIARLRHGEPEAGPFSERYVFPDAAPLHLSRVQLAFEQAGLETETVEGFRTDYERTLGHWMARLDAGAERALELAGPERLRVWRLYLRAAQSGFRTGFTSIYQLKMVRPV